MSKFIMLTRRNTKLFFKDKGMFFTSLITPMILIVLFVTFLGNVYRDSIKSVIPQGVTVPESLIEGFVGGQVVFITACGLLCHGCLHFKYAFGAG